MTAIWHETFLKDHKRGARQTREAAQFDRDWESAELLLERAMSDACGGCIDCPLPACRRAFRCVGNRPICMPRCAVELVPGAEQEFFEKFYAAIQQERGDAATEDRAPDVIRALTHRVHEDRVPDPGPPALAAIDVERKISVAAPPHSSVTASAPEPQQLLPRSAPAAPPATPRPPPDVEERVNRKWAEYVAAPEAFRARHRRCPRIRSME